MINHFFKLRLIGLGSFYEENTFSMTTHCTLHIYVTYRMFGSTGPRANKSVEIVGPVYLHPVLLHSGPAVRVWVCECVCVRERECRESVSFVVLPLPFPLKMVTD